MLNQRWRNQARKIGVLRVGFAIEKTGPAPAKFSLNGWHGGIDGQTCVQRARRRSALQSPDKEKWLVFFLAVGSLHDGDGCDSIVPPRTLLDLVLPQPCASTHMQQNRKSSASAVQPTGRRRHSKSCAMHTVIINWAECPFRPRQGCGHGTRALGPPFSNPQSSLHPLHALLFSCCPLSLHAMRCESAQP